MLEALIPLALLACPIGMGVMMWMMMRGQDKPESADQSDLTALQAQVDQLQAQQSDRDRAGTEDRRPS
jgi:nitrogen fixation-related uncharacterized protein